MCSNVNRIPSLQNHAQLLTHLPQTFHPRHQEAWHRWPVLLLWLSFFLQSNEWILTVEGVKLNLQILKAEGDFLQGLTISPTVSGFSSNKLTTSWESPPFGPLCHRTLFGATRRGRRVHSSREKPHPIHHHSPPNPRLHHPLAAPSNRAKADCHLEWCAITPECTRMDGRYQRRYYWIGDGQRMKPSRLRQFKSPPSKSPVPLPY